MGSLCTFCVLEHLDTDTMILFGDSYSLVQNFQTSLPPSIQEVKLHGEHRNNNALRLHLTSLVESREVLPNLRGIQLFETELSYSEQATSKDMCATVNISLDFVFVESEGSRECLPLYIDKGE